MDTVRLGVIMNGVTGRMGTNQHLIRSINAIRAQGGVPLADGRRIMPEPLLVGRNAQKIEALAHAHDVARWTTDLDAALADPDYAIYFDSASTGLRPALIRKAIAAGKHVYTEKPVAPTVADALDLYRRAQAAGIKHGVVQDKLWLPGLLKLRTLVDSGFFGRILSVRGEFGYWVFEGDWQLAQRPSWNYRKEDDGGIIVDMLCHWRYVLDNLFGGVRSVMCVGATHIPQRWDENGKPYAATADDAAYATFELDGGNGPIIAQINSSWCTRVRRDDLVTFHVDGTLGSAVAGLTDCRIQPRAATPKPVWNPDVPQTIDFYDTWQLIPDNRMFDNAFKVEWELYLRHVVEGGPFRWNLLEGAKGVQLAELGLQSWRERRFVDVPALPL
ncbi:MAG: Gfo/Idh/MocA family oxidoreductase [Betaproteobacteria bacterium]|nr:Gfo/Idh/MocA family oxidoreductase [Betaproteobacteria bacterium]MBA3776381.1 Gfo/Idh/MocA family oxidoreductase [Betaproteobacteria bacterium]